MPLINFCLIYLGGRTSARFKRLILAINRLVNNAEKYLSIIRKADHLRLPYYKYGLINLIRE